MTEQSQDYSDHIAKEIDNEINALIQDAYDGATDILKTNKKALIEISKILLEQEVIEGNEFLTLVEKFQKTKPKKSLSIDDKTSDSTSDKPKRKRSTPKKTSTDKDTKDIPISLNKPIDQVG